MSKAITSISKAWARWATSCTDAAEADDADRLAVELGPLATQAVPATVDQGAVGLGKIAEEGRGEGEGVLGGSDRV